MSSMKIPNIRKEILMPNKRWPHLKIAVIIPCLNEEASIASVVEEARRVLPEATIYVYDNASTDKTIDCAIKAGAIVRSEPRRGKGNVVCRMFADIEADIYFMIDGDLTYDLTHIEEHINILLERQLDMIVGARVAVGEGAYRLGHHYGNQFFNLVINLLYGSKLVDIFSGYRVMSCRFVKTFPTVTEGFEIETELSVHALDLRLEVVECPVHYKDRPHGSESKLNTIRDGIAILIMMITLFKETSPFKFFGIWTGIFVFTSVFLAYPVIIEFFETGLVDRLPTAVLASGLMVLASISLTCGLILDSISKGRNEVKRLEFLKFGARQQSTSKTS